MSAMIPHCLCFFFARKIDAVVFLRQIVVIRQVVDQRANIANKCRLLSICNSRRRLLGSLRILMANTIGLLDKWRCQRARVVTVRGITSCSSIGIFGGFGAPEW